MDDADEGENACVEAALMRLLPLKGMGPDERRLLEAMRHAVRGGKRLRARLVDAAGEIAGAGGEDLDRWAAVEMVHAFSLVHDDLPALDENHVTVADLGNPGPPASTAPRKGACWL